MTYIDKSIDLFFQEAGGLDFLGLIFALLIIFAVIYALVKPFDF